MFSNPKRAKARATAKESWFDFYAGYSAAFVQDVLPHVLPNSKRRVLDPWNGSGTTTTTAHELGIDSTGVDINPVMIVVAKAKLLSLGVVDSILPLCEDLISKAKRTGDRVQDGDPLLEWFAPSGALPIRSLAEAISKLLISAEVGERLYHSDHVGKVSEIAAFFLVSLFRTARSLLVRFRPTNPTWIKPPESDRQRVRPAPEKVFEEFRSHVRQMSTGLAPVSGQAHTVISLGSSDALPLEEGSADAVITSPPYCTRIDYAVATKPELAILACPLDGEFELMRRRMLGGPVINTVASRPQPAWGESCVAFLKAVESHPSKGSGNYYHKLFVQYYAAMHNSLREISRVLVPGGQCVLVVQDSHYKEVHVDVAGHVSDMVRKLGWTIKNRFDFPASLVMARMNPKVQKYRANAGATESVLWFRTAT